MTVTLLAIYILKIVFLNDIFIMTQRISFAEQSHVRWMFFQIYCRFLQATGLQPVAQSEDAFLCC